MIEKLRMRTFLHKRFPWLVANALTMAALLFLPTQAVLADCSGFPIVLSSQTAVDNFQSNYGPCITVSGNLEIYGNTVIDLTPLSDLTTITGYLSISNSTSLVSLAGLENLETIGVRLSIENTTNLINLAGLSGLTTLGSLSISNNSALNSLNGLPAAFDDMSFIIIANNLTLPNLNGLPSVANLVQSIAVTGNSNLTDVSDLSLIDFVDEAMPTSMVIITDNPLLPGLNGFPFNTKVGRFEIRDNDVLSNLDGASGLVEVWGFLRVSGNPMLSDCSALTTVLDDVDDGGPGPSALPDPPDSPAGEVIIGSNLEGCNTIEEIVGSAPDGLILKDGFEGPG